MKCFLATGWLFTFLLCLHCIIVTDVKAQNILSGGTVNNYELLTSLGNDLVEKVVKKSGLINEKACVFLLTSRKDSINWFLEKRLSSYLINSGYEVYSTFRDSLPKLDYKNYLIEFNTIEIGIKYRADVTVDLKLERTGFLNADFRITELETNKVLLNDIFFESVTDWVDVSEKEDIENQNIDITIGEISEGLPTVRFKPLIITMVTGTIVYLFYALRSR